jgi:hypothetical protein
VKFLDGRASLSVGRRFRTAEFPPMPGWYVLTVKGDRVEIVIDSGDGTQTYEVTATRAGRRVEVSTGRGIVEVSEVTRSGTTVRTARFMASRVVALVEHPVDATRVADAREAREAGE